MKIGIDFVPGSHGNYLEFVLNKLLLGDAIQSTPFNQAGASHMKTSDYYKKRVVECAHWYSKGPVPSQFVISIQFKVDDLLPLVSISLDRAGDVGIKDNELHKDTFNKLNIKNYNSTLHEILKNYNQISEYNDIKADSWPDITTVEDFYKLPSWIIEECKTVYGFEPKIIDSTHPDIDRSILREFFKFGFKFPEEHGLSLHQRQMKYKENQKVYYFPYIDFYNLEKFKNRIEEIKDFFNLTFNDYDVTELHTEFLKRQPYKDIKIVSDLIINNVINGGDTEELNLTLFQESYINAQLELKYNIEFPFKMEKYFSTTKDIYNFIQHEISKRH